MEAVKSSIRIKSQFKITGYGFGFSYNALDVGKANISIGINEFGEKTFHFILENVTY